MATKLNPSQQDYDEKFRELTESPENTAFDDQTERLAQDIESDSFSYTGDPDREKIRREEKLEDEDKPQEKSSSAVSGNPESSLYNPESQSRSRVSGALSGLQNSFKKGSSRKKLLFAAGGVGGVGMIAAIAIIAFMLIAGFGLGQVATVLQTSRFGVSRFVNMRRQSQLVTQIELKSATGATDNLKSLSKSGLYSKIRGYDRAKVLTTLGKENQFVVHSVTDPMTGKLATHMTVGTEVVTVPERSRFNIIRNWRNEKEFVRSFESALNTVDPFVVKNRYARTKLGRDMLSAAGVKLYRWTEAGRNIRNFQDTLKDKYSRLKKDSPSSSGVDDVKRAVDQVDDAVDETIDEGVRIITTAEGEATDQIADRAVAKAAEKASSNGIKNFSRNFSLITLGAFGYCMANDYTNNLEAAPAKNDSAFKKQAGLTLSAYDQYKSGDTSGQAVMNEAKSLDGFSDTKAMQVAYGNPDAAALQEDLGEADYPYPSNDSAFIGALNAITPGGDGTINRVVNGSCGLLTSTAGGAFLTAIDVGLTLVSSGAKQYAAEGIEVGIKEALRRGVTSSATRKVAAKQIATDASLVVLIDIFTKEFIKKDSGIDNAGLGGGQDTAARADVGMKIVGSEECVASGCRPLTPQQSSSVKSFVNDQRLAELHEKSLFTRVFSPSIAYSPTAQFIASIPVTGNRAYKVKNNQLAKMANPLKSIAQNSGTLFAAAIGSNKPVYAAGMSEMYGFSDFGYSTTELDKMLDESYWPYENANWIEENGGPAAFSDLDKCFESVLKTVVDNRGDCSAEKLSADRAFRYRLYRADNQLMDQTLELQEITSEASTPPTQTVTPGQISSDSSATPCAAGTDDLGIRDDAYNNGQRIRIRLCGLNSITGPGLSNQSNAEVGTGKPMVSSVFSESWQKLGEAFETDNGSKLAVGSSWRTMTHQQKLYDDASVPGVSAATPGESNHQTGAALDISVIYQSVNGGIKRGATCSNPQGSNTLEHRWLTANASRFGIKNYAVEAWHWGPLEQC